MAANQAIDPRVEAGYGRFPEVIERDWLGRWCHLSEADLGLIGRRSDETTRLGFAVQLATVRAIGTFLADPSDVAGPVVGSVARQLDIVDPGLLGGYAKMPVRWRHASEIRERYGYVDFSSGPANGAVTRALFRLAWNDDLGPTALFRAAHTRMLTDRMLLPGQQLLEFERELIRERTHAGLTAARARGRVGGRPSALSAAQTREARRMYESGEYTWVENSAPAARRSTSTYAPPTPTGEHEHPAPDPDRCELPAVWRAAPDTSADIDTLPARTGSSRIWRTTPPRRTRANTKLK